MIVLVYLLSVALNNQISCNNLPQCDAWSALEQKLKSDDQGVTCNKFSNCSGMKCSGTLHGNEIHASIEVNHCETPVSIVLAADMPELGINAWRRKFTHGDGFNLTDMIIGQFTIQKENDNLTIGLDIDILVGVSKILPHLLNAPMKFPVFHNVVIPVSPCSKSEEMHNSIAHIVNISSTSASHISSLRPFLSSDLQLEPGNCTITNSSCGPLEICRQLHKFKSDGICVCITDYIRDHRGKCIYNPSVETSTNTPSHVDPSHRVEPSNKSVLLTAILVPITVIVLVVGIAYATIRFRVCQYLRRRLRVQVYEHVQLGQDDDNDEQLTNPVA